MTRLMLLDGGEELDSSNVESLKSRPAPVRVKLLGPAPPFPEGQVVHVAPVRESAPGARTLRLFRADAGFRLCSGREALAGGELLGRIVALEGRELTFSLERGVLALVPTRWLPRAVGLLDVLGKLRRPLTPSVYLGSPEANLAGVRDKYDRRAEAHEYSHRALADFEPLEREVVERYVRPAGRLLDIGCGAGREAFGFARAGFRVVGIDIAPRMIDAARERVEREGLAITFRVQSATELEDPPGSFDGAYWAGSFHHVPGRALRVETLRRIGRALAPDGVLILMVLYRARLGFLSRTRVVDFLRKAGSWLGRRWNLSEPGDGYMREVSDASDPREACFFHDFSGPSEVRGELDAAGLAAEEVAPGWWICRKTAAPLVLPD